MLSIWSGLKFSGMSRDNSAPCVNPLLTLYYAFNDSEKKPSQNIVERRENA